MSIHPDGERWLISECTDRIEPPRMNCYLFLYNQINRSYQRYALPAGFIYADAQFSSTGTWIVGVRTKLPENNSYEEKVRSYAASEIFMLRVDGTGFRIVSAPKGRIRYPTLAPDESKVAYWVSGRVRRPHSKTTFMDFDIHEFDLISGKDALFAGTYKFYFVNGLKYKNNSELVADAFGPAEFITSMGSYAEKFGSSEVYLFRRGVHEFPKPKFSSIPSATSPTFSKSGRTFVLGSTKSHGLSIVETNEDGEIRHWRIPMLARQGMASISVSPTDAYIVFLYPTTSASSPDVKNSLGIFDLLEERWVPVSLPPPDSARFLRIQN